MLKEKTITITSDVLDSMITDYHWMVNAIKEIRALKLFIGQDASLLMLDPTYKKLNKVELIRTIKEKRELLKFLFENLDEAKQNELKLRVEEDFKSNGLPYGG
ncbi:hypothetical protein [Lysinibacillus sp. JNUCC 51]|uniref:hypothetical protein n=1 Tax=Lysinibacillus sp. JNUCC-51 TaxID=2792479 RepID=UPI001937ADC2|nr:hypothetical protein JNUCC51_23160 [Lysinibacillus sp. JNUCC-51]